MKQRAKDKFYRRNLKSKTTIAISLLIVSSLIMCLFRFLTSNESNFMETAIITQAEIIDVKYTSHIKEASKVKYQQIDVDDAKYITLKYIVNGKEYTEISKTMDSTMYIGKKINIYYNQQNPKEFVVSTFSVMNIMPLVLLIILIGSGVIAVIVATKEWIRYIQTLNGIEIKVDIIRVIPVKKWWYMEYKIECKGEDESGVLRTFYSRYFTEPYLEKEIEKLKSKKLTVRYKKHHPEKYIVLTEELERRLSV